MDGKRRYYMEKPIIVYFQDYQHVMDPEADNYQAEVAEFLRSNKIEKYAKGVYVVDGDRDGYTMVAELLIPPMIAVTLGSGLTTKPPAELSDFPNELER